MLKHTIVSALSTRRRMKTEHLEELTEPPLVTWLFAPDLSLFNRLLVERGRVYLERRLLKVLNFHATATSIYLR